MKGNKIELSKIYSREKPLIHFCVWHESDVEGNKRFLKKNLKNTLFVIHPTGTKGEIWYPNDDYHKLIELAIKMIGKDAELRRGIINNLKNNWDKLRVYVENGKEIYSIKEASKYYKNFVSFWSSINCVLFEVPGLPGIDPGFSKDILSIRSIAEKYTDEMGFKLTRFFEKRFPQFAHLSHFITMPEMERISKRVDIHFQDELEERAKRGCFIFNGTVRAIKEMNSFLKKRNIILEKINTSDVKHFSGSIAYPGLVSGVAKVILGKKDLSKIKEGDILIASMTAPDYISAMKKSAAIVTDEGGITCHAAIVARELKKPCIIGTKIATKVLKDDMILEVDADKGVVKIIKQ